MQEVAERLGYVRDPKLSEALAYARKEDKTIYRESLALFSDIHIDEREKRSWLNDIYEAALSRSKQLGYGLEYVNYPSSPREQKAIIRQLYARGIRGLIFTPRMGVPTFYLDIDFSKFSCVEIGQVMEPTLFPRIVRDMADDYLNRLKDLHTRGYRRIGLAISDFEEQRHKWAFLSAFLSFHYIHKDDPSVIEVQGYPQWGKVQLFEWLKREQPDVIITNGSAIGKWLKEEGWCLPDDIGLCRVDGTKGAWEAGLCPDYSAMALNAVNWLVSSLEYGNLGLRDSPPVLCIPNTWNEGNTLKKKV